MPTISEQRSSLTVTAAAMIGAVPVLTLAMWTILAPDGFGEFPALWAPLTILLAAVLAYGFCELLGFRTAPLEYGGDPASVEAESWRRFTASTFLRFAACEAVFMISIPLGFVVDSFWVVLVAAALALPLFGWEVWPGPHNQARFAASLEARGVPSYLSGRPQD